MKRILIIPLMMLTLVSCAQSKRVGTSINTSAGSGTWGFVTGNLPDQTDLQAALSAKAALSHTHSTDDVVSGTFGSGRLGTGTSSTATFLKGGSFATWTGIVITDVSGLQAALDAKQAALVSGTSIKTINSVPLLGSGNIVVTGQSDSLSLDPKTFKGLGTTNSPVTATVPEYTTAERDALIDRPRLIFNTTTNHPNYWNGSAWVQL